VRVLDTRPLAGGSIGYDVYGNPINPLPIWSAYSQQYRIAGMTFGGFTFPGDLTGLLANVTLVQDTPSGGYAVVYSADRVAPPKASTVNPSTAIAHNFWAIETAGRIAAYSTNRAHLIVDVVGYWSPDNQPALGDLRFVDPVRVLDTRAEAGGPLGFDAGGNPISAAPFTPNGTRRFHIAGKSFGGGFGAAEFFPNDVAGILAHVTTVQGAGSGGYVTIFPGDQPAPPNASTVNPSTPIAFNSFATAIPTTGEGAGSFAVYSTNQLDVIVDVMGYWSGSNPADLGQLTLIDPTRVVETRGSAGPIGYDQGGSPLAPGPFAPNTTRRFLLAGQRFGGIALPNDIRGVLANVTSVQGAPSGGFVTAFAGDVPDAQRPNASTVNPGTAIAASFWANGIPASGPNAGTEAIYSTNPLDVVVDVVGFFR
jgi:hypothetical protein